MMKKMSNTTLGKLKILENTLSGAQYMMHHSVKNDCYYPMAEKKVLENITWGDGNPS